MENLNEETTQCFGAPVAAGSCYGCRRGGAGLGLSCDTAGLPESAGQWSTVGEDGKLDFARKHDIDIGPDTQWWTGMIPLA